MMKWKYFADCHTCEDVKQTYKRLAKQLHKYMKCYIYQCSEDPVCDTPLYNAVLETSRMLADLIVIRLDGYDDKEWN